MKPSTLIGLLLLTVMMGGLVVTNPGPDAYERYASEQVEMYLTTEVCTDLPPGITKLLAQQCEELVQTLQPRIGSLIRENTKRLNIGIASLYSTSFGVPELVMLPRYEVETIGILRRFLTYRATQLR